MAVQATHLYLSSDRFLFATAALRSASTARAAATLLVSAGGRPFDLVAAGGERVRCLAAFVPPHVRRGLDAEDCGGLVSLNIDPASPELRALLLTLGRQSIRPLRERLPTRVITLLEGALHGQVTNDEARSAAAALVQAVCGAGRGALPVPDPRMNLVAQRLRLAPAAGLAGLAAEVHLSPTRLSHLFHEHSGVSIKTYRLWTKLRRGVTDMANRRNLTEVAAGAGFADLPHMTRTFRGMFGLTPSYLADRSQVDLRADHAGLVTWGIDADAVA